MTQNEGSRLNTRRELTAPWVKELTKHSLAAIEYNHYHVMVLSKSKQLKLVVPVAWFENRMSLTRSWLGHQLLSYSGML